MNLPKQCEIIEVGPRDGLQSQKEVLSTENKIKWIMALCEAGFKRIEVGAFVSPKAIPAMADSLEVIRELPRDKGVRFAALVPNEKGLETALNARVDEVAVFTAASESFCQKNINTSIQGSLKRFKPVIDTAQQEGLRTRAYVSCIVSCPYEGRVESSSLWPVMDALNEMKVDEISLGDTLGTANPLETRKLFAEVFERYGSKNIAGHFHDTYGRALLNIWELLQLGFTKFDASAGGLGGCPYAPGASGNVASEDVFDFLSQLNVATGLKEAELYRSSELLQSFLSKSLPSKCFQAKNTYSS